MGGRQPQKDVPQNGPAKVKRSLRGVRIGVGIACVLLLAGTSFVLGRIEGHREAQAEPDSAALDSSAPGARILKSGPWGEVECIPMSIGVPDSLLPVREWAESATHWLFKGFSRDDLAKLLDSAGLPAAQRDKLLSPECLHAAAAGLDMTPPREIMVALSPKAREKIYEVLHRFPENTEPLMAFNASTLEKNFNECGVSDEAEALFKKLSSSSGDRVLFSSLPCLMAELPNYAEQCRTARAITRESTLLLKVHVTPTTDINALTEYYGKGCWRTDVRAMLESLSQIPGGAWVNVARMMPPRPAGLLYKFPQPQNAAEGPPVSHNCYWTALNFLKEKSDPALSSPEHLNAALAADYAQVAGDPRYGDVVLLMQPDYKAIHAAVFIAGDVVYTKNGESPLRPWTLTTVSQLLKEFACVAEPGKELRAVYYRNRNN